MYIFAVVFNKVMGIVLRTAQTTFAIKAKMPYKDNSLADTSLVKYNKRLGNLLGQDGCLSKHNKNSKNIINMARVDNNFTPRFTQPAGYNTALICNFGILDQTISNRLTCTSSIQNSKFTDANISKRSQSLRNFSPAERKHIKQKMQA